MIDLRQGDWRDVLADVECDALICDPPYGSRTHESMSRVKSSDGSVRSVDFGYLSFDESKVTEFCNHFAPRTKGWFCVLTSHDLGRHWESALESHGRYVFAPLACVMKGQGVRLVGDGPSNWAVWLIVSRPRNKEFSNWGSLPGAYTGTPGNRNLGFMGGKPVWLMNAIIRDYTRPGDLVCDPCAGMATTAIACESLGRNFIGSEIDPETFARALRRISAGVQMDIFGGTA